MTDWWDRFTQIASFTERLAVLGDNLKTVLAKVEDHEKRLVRVETIIEIARPDGITLRIATPRAEG